MGVAVLVLDLFRVAETRVPVLDLFRVAELPEILKELAHEMSSDQLRQVAYVLREENSESVPVARLVSLSVQSEMMLHEVQTG